MLSSKKLQFTVGTFIINTLLSDKPQAKDKRKDKGNCNYFTI